MKHRSEYVTRISWRKAAFPPCWSQVVLYFLFKKNTVAFSKKYDIVVLSGYARPII